MTGASAASSIRPLFSSLICNSEAEHSMPLDSTPRSLAFLILKSPGSSAPIMANGIRRPGRTFGAPHFANHHTTENTGGQRYAVHFQTGHGQTSHQLITGNSRVYPTTQPLF